MLPEIYLGRQFRKGEVTMDVWFDLENFWAAVMSTQEVLAHPEDRYFEGSGKHRGLFQSSILMSVATEGKVSYKRVLKLRFAVYEKGVKMIKRIGNPIDPLVVINTRNNKTTYLAYGEDVMRLWVCSVKYVADIMIGPSVLRKVADVYKSIRNTCNT